MRSITPVRFLAGLSLLCHGAPAPAIAQEGGAEIRAGASYDAGELHRFLLGSGYRDLWTTPIRVPVLRPDTFAGGLTLLQRGEGMQTASLRFADPGGRQYVFRSVDKTQRGGLHPDLRDTWVSAIIQDQVSAKHPAAALLVAPLLEAAGVLHASPRLAVMADHPVLGEYREEFSGMLGIIEERPDDADGTVSFQGHPRVIGTERLLERLEESSEDRVDAPAYLRARLMDLLIGDWDRHPDQWRWAEQERDGARYWLPIPRDRDNAFSRFGGVAAVVGAALRPTIVSFGPDYSDLYPMLHNAQPLDRRIFSEVPPETWTAIALDLQQRLTDAVIDRAVLRMPESYQRLNAEVMAAALKSRRDALPVVAKELFEMVSSEVDVHGTAEADVAIVEHLPSGRLRVELRNGALDGARFFEREFAPSDTREVRIYLGEGDDRAVVRGVPTSRSKVRVIGGGGDDVLADSTSVSRSDRVYFYGDRGEDTFLTGPRTRVDRRPYESPSVADLAENNAPPPRDWGRSSSLLAPGGDWVSDIGPVLALGPRRTRYGFRRAPYAAWTGAAVEYAPLHTRFGLVMTHRQQLTGGGGEARVGARITGISATRFHGFGNETPLGEDPSIARVWATEYSAEIEIAREFGELRLSGGPLVSYLEPEAQSGSPAAILAPLGTTAYGTVGIRVAGEFDARDSPSYPRRGLRLRAYTTTLPLSWGGVEEPFGTVGGVGSVYLPLPLPLETTMALRAGGERAWGTAPLQHLAFVGGGSTLRGYKTRRFAGDGAAFGGADVRVLFGRVNLGLARGDLGALALADAGRVWWPGEDSRRWHAGFGGGLWFATFGRSMTGHALVAHGEGYTLSAGIGMPF